MKLKNLSKIILLVFLQTLQTASAQFSISSNQRYLLKDGKPFFWLGDTGWELFHRLSREEAGQYLKRRSEQGFTIIQAVVLAEMDGLHTPNPYGNTPLLNDDPAKPNEKYFEHVDYIIDKAASYNLNIGLLPTWGDKVFKDKWGTGPEIFNEQNAAAYGRWIANRYKNRTNIIWILGGDRYPRHEIDIAIWRAMALAIKKETNQKAVITFHTQPNLLGSAEWFLNEQWFSFNMFQTGHCREIAVYDRIKTSYNSQPVKPVIDGEPIYEDHPVCFNEKDLGTSSAYDVRKAAYLDLFAGAFGHTYGCHDIWQFYSAGREGINGPHVYWQQAMELPGANQMIHVKKLMESHPFAEHIPDQSLIKENNYSAAERIQATRGNDYLFVYTAAGKPFTVLFEKIKGDKLQSYWFNPRDGKITPPEIIDIRGSRRFTPPSSGYGQDWVLVIDDAAKKYATNLAVAQNKTGFTAETGEYAVMLQQLEQAMMKNQEKRVDTLGGKQRNIFVRWIRDHVHVMKAMKYIHPDMKSFIEFFLENQTAEGLYFDYYFPLGWGGAGSRKKIFDKRYWKEFPEDSIEMHRLPVEADLEYLLVEGAYAVWQSTGDIDFVKKWLPALVKGIKYSMTDPLRWSEKYQLIKRGYTLDTWDFMQLPLPRAEYTKNGGNVQKGIFDIDAKTPMGIMHGDNSGIYAACKQLAKLFAVTGNIQASKKWQNEAEGFRQRTNALCWNGKFYAHFIEDDPQPSYLKMDQNNTLSLSNPYDINRGLPTEKMAQSIIETYKDLKENNQSNSFAEWYGVYPAVQPHFADYKPGSYMNGGVNTIVAGELAKAALQHGYEAYGIDILKRIMELMKKHHGDLPVAYTPDGKVDAGIPDNWGQAAVYSALIEGLAGVVDKSAQFREVEISPRWLAAGKNAAQVKVNYGPANAGIGYSYAHNAKTKIIQLNLNGNFENSVVRLLLPADYKNGSALVNKKLYSSTIEKINGSYYVVIKGLKGKNVAVEVNY